MIDEKAILDVKPDIEFDAVPREKILKLAQKMTPRSGVTIQTDDPEYYGLACITTDEMADIALVMKIRKPYTFAQLEKITPYKGEKLQSLLDKMAYEGLIEYNWQNKIREKQYILPILVPGSAEFTNMRWEEMEEHPELARYFDRMTLQPLAKVGSLVPMGGAGIGMHVIPVEKAISMENKSVSVEHISHWLDKYDTYAASPCSCRMGRQFLGEASPDDWEDWCIGLGDYARYLEETDKGHLITKEEALAIFEKAEKNGYVHQITNIDGEDKIFAICNCNKESCTAIRSTQMFNTPNLMRSAYVAHVDKEKCVACGKCVEYCPAGALKLGQKLCSKLGPVTYPKQELPGEVPWTSEKWNVDFKNTNRINTHKTGTSPCKTACPAHVSVQGYLKLASQGKFKEALALIKKDNPFPAVCGRVCNHRCEDACTRATIDQAVAIDAVKKFVAEQDLNAETRYIPEIIVGSNRGNWKEKIAIIGAGPAGLTCAFYLASIGYNPTVFEKNEKPGGMMTYGIPSFKLEKDIIQAEIEVMKEMGVEIRCGVEVGKDITIQQLRDQGYKGFFLAVGCQGGRMPNVAGEDALNTITAVDFLKHAQEDEEQKISGKVIVIGGGNVAIDCARTAHRFSAESVEMYCLESRDTMPASKEEILEAEDEAVEIRNGWGPKEILKDESGKVKAVVFKKCVSTLDADGRFNPVYDEDTTITVEADYVVYAIGQTVVWGDLLKGENVEMARGAYPAADPKTLQTNVPDLFVGGDVLTGPKFVIDAIAQGREAAESLHRFVRPHVDLKLGREPRYYIEFDKENAIVENYDNSARQIEGMDDSVDYRNSFRDAHKTFTKEQAVQESKRCLGCGLSIVDENKCYGCGVCTTKCPMDAITLHRDNPKASRMHSNEEKMRILLPIIIKRKLKFRKYNKK